MPVWRFAIGDIVLEQRIWLEPGANTSYVAYRLAPESAARDLKLKVRLLVNGRDHHVKTQMNEFQPVLEAPDPASRRVHTPDFTLRLWVRGGGMVDDGNWFENYDLPIEHERGLAHRDHHFCLGEAVLTLRPGVPGRNCAAAPLPHRPGRTGARPVPFIARGERRAWPPAG